MIDAELTALLKEPVMMVFAAKSAAGLPALGRALGARPAPDGRTIDIFTPAAQWGEALSGLAPGSPLAFTFVQPNDYRTFQLKGELISIAPSGPEDVAAAAVFLASPGSRHVTGETLLVDAGTHLGYAPMSMR